MHDHVIVENDSKRAKLEDELVQKDTLTNVLTDFEFVKILNENALNKLLIIHAVKKCGEEGANLNAVVIFEKTHFNLDETKSYLEINNPMKMNIDNDIYKQLSIYPTMPYNSKTIIN